MKTSSSETTRTRQLRIPAGPAPDPLEENEVLEGVHLAFTGILEKPRREAARAARRAGAIVHGMPSAKTSVVVRGRPNVRQAAGRDGGLKLMEIKRLGEKGHEIKILDEARFWRLAERPRAKSRKK